MNKQFIKKAGGYGIAIGLTLLPLLVLAQVPTQGIITSPTQIQDLVQRVLNFVAGIVLTIAIIMLLWSAIMYLTAGGSEDRVSSAKNYLIYAIIGIVIAVLAFSVQPFIENVLRRQF